MTKKITIIVTSLFLVAAAVVLLLLYFIFRKDETSEIYINNIIIEVQDQELTVGETKENFYYINDTLNVEIEFKIENPEIISIQNNKTLTALKPGNTKVKIIASKNSKKTEKEFNVNVIQNAYELKIVNENGCKFHDNIIEVFNEDFQFGIQIYDSSGQLVKKPKYSIYSYDTECEFYINTLIVSAHVPHDCEIKIFNDDFGYEFFVNVVCNY